MTTPSTDPVKLEVWWSRLVAITDEAATTLLRTAFSTIIRESNDYTVVLMNRVGQTIAECRAGIPAFGALMGQLTEHLLLSLPVETWHEGDIVVTNDPWIATGHLPDVAMVTPIFHRDRLVGFTGTAAHLPDIGGTPNMGPTDLMAEGLLIPPLRLQRGGRRNDDFVQFLMSNVRLPAQVWGDLEAQMAANHLCRRRAVEFLDDNGLDGFADLSRALHTASDGSMRRAIASIPDGVYRSTTHADGVPGQPTVIECAVTVRGDQIEVDYGGSSPQVPYATNCTLNYTTAYSNYPLKILLDPHTRSNHGSYRAVKVLAPPGSILNANRRAAVLARHLTGHLASSAIYRALAPVLPERVLADSGGSPALRVQFAGRSQSGDPFALLLFASAGMGASAHADGLATTAFPTNSGAGSIEALEASAPLLFTKKQFRVDSGGAGRYCGGLGQDIRVQNTTGNPLQVVLLGDRGRHPALGVEGGAPGDLARATYDDGTPCALKSISTLPPGGGLTISFPGGGGHGEPAQRDPERVASDLRDGVVSHDAVIRDYGEAKLPGSTAGAHE